jgi:hypothetical protein
MKGYAKGNNDRTSRHNHCAEMGHGRRRCPPLTPLNASARNGAAFLHHAGTAHNHRCPPTERPDLAAV